MMALPLVVTIYVAVVQWNKKKEAQSNVDAANYGAILANSSANQSKECILLQNTQVQECDKEGEQEGRDTGKYTHTHTKVHISIYGFDDSHMEPTFPYIDLMISIYGLSGAHISI